MNKIDGCTYQLLYADRQNHMHSKACNQPPTCNGFCAQHAYCAEVLAEAGKAGYPAFVVAYTRGRDNELEPCYTVGPGLLNWRGYAERHRRSRHEDIMRRLRSMAVARSERQETGDLVGVG